MCVAICAASRFERVSAEVGTISPTWKSMREFAAPNISRASSSIASGLASIDTP